MRAPLCLLLAVWGCTPRSGTADAPSDPSARPSPVPSASLAPRALPPPLSPASSASSLTRPPLAETVCERVERVQSQLLDDARRAASEAFPGQRTANPMYGPAGGLFELPHGVPMWPYTKDAGAALRVRMHTEALARARREKDETALWVLSRSVPSPDAFVNLSRSLYPVGTCRPTPKGAWALEAERVACRTQETHSYLGEAVAWSASLVLAHYDVHDQRVVLAIDTCCGEHFDGEQAHDPPWFFDYDGDGEPEVILHTWILSDGPKDDRLTRIVSFHDGAIVPYAAAAGLELYGSAFDADGDGRPDLRTYAGVQVVNGPPVCDPEPIPPHTPAFLVHAVEGGRFSTTDAVAKAYARSWCPAPPISIREAADAGCARLWARTPEQLKSEKARVEASCLVPDTKKKCSERLPDEIDACASRAEAFSKTPPFTLP